MIKKYRTTVICICCAMAATAAEIPSRAGAPAITKGVKVAPGLAKGGKVAPAPSVPPLQVGVPDLTKGGELTRINEQSVGLLGILCGAWRPKGEKQSDVRQLMVMKVDKGSPAEGILDVGDVILGADGSGAAVVPLFKGADWPWMPIGDAITEAEARNPAILKLLRWRQGKTETVTIKLETLGRYSDTAPYNCEKSKLILRKGIKALYEANKPDKAGLGMLCLLAADDPTNPDNDKVQARAREWAQMLVCEDGPWLSGPQLIALSEYYMKTKDETIFPKLVKAAERHAQGVSWYGTTGHRWCEKQLDGSPNGRISGYGPINCSGTLGFLGLSLARKAGVKSPVVDATIERQSIFFGHYAFRGDIPYGEHPYGLVPSAQDYNGHQSLAGLALGLQDGQEAKSKYFCRTSALSSWGIRRSAHGGCYFGQVFHPIGAAQGGVKSANLQFKEIRWHLDLTRRWDGTRMYEGRSNPQPYADFSYAATALLFYAMPLKQLYITGKGQKESLKLSDAEFKELAATKEFNANPSKATTQELIAALSRAQGLLSNAATLDLAQRMKTTPDSKEWPAVLDQLLALASDSKAGPSGRAGACQVLININSAVTNKMKKAECAKIAVALLKDPDAYVNYAGAKVLQILPPDAVMPHVNEILDAIIPMTRPNFPLNAEDPLRWAHTEMASLLFATGRSTGLLSKGIDGVDRKKLLPAIRSLLGAPRGVAVKPTSTVLAKLTKEEILELAEVLVDTCLYPLPADSMFSRGHETGIIAGLAGHNFEEVLKLSVGTGAFLSKDKFLNKYGQSFRTLSSGEEVIQDIADKMLVKGEGDFSAAIKEAVKGSEPQMLNKLKSIHSVKAAEPVLALPAAKSTLVVDATNYARCGESDTIYTWRKVYGSGKVAFTPNKTWQSKKTTVSFTDQNPGKYRFEVTMSDTLGFTVAKQVVDVTLNDKSGKLPKNAPPSARNIALNAVPSIPIPIVLTGIDPDGDDLGFVVAGNPAHGKLNGVGGNLTYTADFGYNGQDSFKFDVIDGQGLTAPGTVSITASDRNVGVAVYEGFDYPAGPINGREGGTSFGFGGPWKVEGKGTNVVSSGSFNYAALPSTGGKLTKNHPMKRLLDPMAMSKHKLLDPGQELWFSVFVGFEKGPDKLAFGLMEDAKDSKADLGFMFHYTYKLLAVTKSEMVEHTGRNDWSGTPQVRFPPKVPHMIIGRCIWGKTDGDLDTLEIYRVADIPGMWPMLLKDPVETLKTNIDQSKLNTVYIRGTPGIIDEIRLGPTYQSVLLGTKAMQ